MRFVVGSVVSVVGAVVLGLAAFPVLVGVDPHGRVVLLGGAVALAACFVHGLLSVLPDGPRRRWRALVGFPAEDLPASSTPRSGAVARTVGFVVEAAGVLVGGLLFGLLLDGLVPSLAGAGPRVLAALTGIAPVGPVWLNHVVLAAVARSRATSLGDGAGVDGGVS